MAIPVIYNLRSVRARWVSSIVAVLGIAGTVGCFRRDAFSSQRIPRDSGGFGFPGQCDTDARRRDMLK